MLILEGSPFKSVVVEDLIKSKPNSMAFIYGTTDLPLRGNIFVMSDDVPIEKCIKQIVARCTHGCTILYEYIIFYTNKQRKDLDDMILKLDGIEGNFCNCLILICKKEVA